MNKVFIDTNVFIRFLTEDDPKKFKECQQFFKLIEKGSIRPYTSNIVILEIQFILAKQYNVPKNKILNDIEDLLSLRRITLIEKTNSRAALKLYKKNNIKYPDCLIASQVPPGVKLVSYDEDFSKIGTLSPITPADLL